MVPIHWPRAAKRVILGVFHSRMDVARYLKKKP